MAYSTMQRRMLRITDSTGGYLSYVELRNGVSGNRHRMVLGEPIAEMHRWGDLVDEVLAGQVDTIFFQVGAEFAELMRSRGYRVAGFGYESSLRLPFSLRGKYRSEIRRMLNRAEASGVKVFELDSVGRLAAGIGTADIRRLVQEWLSTRVVRHGELRFLARPLEVADEPGVRKYYALAAGELCGLAVYDPLFRNGKTIGYTESIVRVGPEAPKGTRDLLLCTALNDFSREGYRICSLGLSPLAPLPEGAGGLRAVTTCATSDATMRLLYHTLDRVAFNFKGTAFKKSRYVRPELEEAVQFRPVYIASRRRLMLVDAYLLAVAMGVSPWRQILHLPAVAAGSGIRAVPALISGLIR